MKLVGNQIEVVVVLFARIWLAVAGTKVLCIESPEIDVDV